MTERIVSAIKSGGDGAVCVFDGIVRDNTRGRATLHLDYEAYEEMALKQMRACAREAIARFGVREVAIVHRLGRLFVGETSVLIAVSSAHRGAAFDACRYVIDTLKKTVPIWKREQFADGAVWADGEPFRRIWAELLDESAAIASRCWAVALGLLITVTPATAAMPQQQRATTARSDRATKDGQTPTIHVESRLVNVALNVVDETGAPVGGLTRDDFEIAEDGQPQKIAIFDRESTTPLEIVLAIDASESVLGDERLE